MWLPYILTREISQDLVNHFELLYRSKITCKTIARNKNFGEDIFNLKTFLLLPSAVWTYMHADTVMAS